MTLRQHPNLTAALAELGSIPAPQLAPCTCPHPLRDHNPDLRTGWLHGCVWSNCDCQAHG